MNVDTRGRLLHEAEVLIRTCGYSAFSYADLAERVGIAKASVHYYFPSKEDLIVVLLREYIARVGLVLAAVKVDHPDAIDRLRGYGRLFLDGFEQGMLPLCGALSAERAALPAAMRPQVRDFFQLQLDWLAQVVAEGIAAGRLDQQRVPADVAMMLFSTLEGGSFVGWALEKSAPVLAAFESALRDLGRQTGKRRKSQPSTEN